LLSTDVGPYYDLPSAYVVVAFVWSILVVGWLAGLLRHGFSNATRLHRFMLSVPLIKLFIVSVAASFWVGCERDGLCSFWLGVLWVNMQLIYETSYILIFVLLSKGWCITSEHLTRTEWRSVLMSVCIFYMAESMLLVFKEYMGWAYWVFTCILFGTFIVSIFRGVSEHVLVLRRQLDHADTERLNVLAQLVFGKLRVLRIFQYVLVFYSIMELVVHLIIDVGTNQLNTTMIMHEWVEIIVAVVLGYICVPNLTSSLYYQGLGPALNQNMRVIPFFKATLWYNNKTKTISTINTNNVTDQNDDENQNRNTTEKSDGMEDVNIMDIDSTVVAEAGEESMQGLPQLGMSQEEKEKEKQQFQKNTSNNQKSKHVRRLSFKRRLSKRSSVASDSSLRSSMLDNEGDNESNTSTNGGEGETKNENSEVPSYNNILDGASGASGESSDSNTMVSTHSIRPSQEAASATLQVEIQPIARPRWMFVKRDVDDERSRSDRTTLVIVQNPSRVDIQMAARVTHSRGSFVIGNSSRGRGGSTTSKLRPKNATPLNRTPATNNDNGNGNGNVQGSSEGSDEEEESDESDDDEILMRGRANSSEDKRRRPSNVSRDVEMTTIRRASGSRGRPAPPPAPPVW